MPLLHDLKNLLGVNRHQVRHDGVIQTLTSLRSQREQFRINRANNGSADGDAGGEAKVVMPVIRKGVDDIGKKEEEDVGKGFAEDRLVWVSLEHNEYFAHKEGYGYLGGDCGQLATSSGDEGGFGNFEKVWEERCRWRFFIFGIVFFCESFGRLLQIFR